MKKICLFLVSLTITGFCAFSQKISPDNPCKLKDEVRNVVRVADSLSRFVRHMEETLPADNWNAFNTAVRNYLGLEAFNNCGPFSAEFRGIYTAIGKDLGEQFNTLIVAIDPGRVLPDRDMMQKLQEAFDCYFADAEENILPDLKTFGFPAPEKAEGGPCEIAARSCCNEARRNYHTALRQCLGAAVGVGGLIGGWLGAGVGLFCAVQASNDQWHDFRVCIVNYEDCLENQ